MAGAKQPTRTMTRRGDGGGSRGVRTENSKQPGRSRLLQEFGNIVSPTVRCRKDVHVVMTSTLCSGKACEAEYCASSGGMSEWMTQR